MKKEVELFNYITGEHWTDDDYYWIKEAVLDREFILGHNNIDWDWISQSKDLPESFIHVFSDKVCWVYISMTQKLSEDFIRYYSNKVDWHWISTRQELSESFIREFKDKVDFEYLSAKKQFQTDEEIKNRRKPGWKLWKKLWKQD